MENKKINRVLAIIVIAVVFIVGIVFFLLNFTTSNNSYSIVEKKWLTDNQNKIVDVDVFNNIPIYGYNGMGIIFNFLDDFSKDNNINFNKISYLTTDNKKLISNISFISVNDNEMLNKNDILLYEDNYVVISKEDTILENINDLSKVGIIDDYKSFINYYLNDTTEVIEYQSYSKLFEEFESDKIEYVIVPSVQSMYNIVNKKYNIVYKVNDVTQKYVLRVKDDTLYSIMDKYYKKYLDNYYEEDYRMNYLNAYFNAALTPDIDRKNYNNKIYKYGYAVNMPYENVNDTKFGGTISNYLLNFEKIFNIEINTIKYSTIDEVKTALINGDIDFALSNFNYDGLNMNKLVTKAITTPKYVVLSKDNRVINSIKSLKGSKVDVVISSSLYNLCKENNIETNNYNDTDDLLRNISDDSIILLDEATYIYYKDNKLIDYKVVFSDNNQSLSFIFNNNDEVLYNVINYYISTVNYDMYRYSYNTSMEKNRNYADVNIILISIGIIIILLLGFIIYVKASKKELVIKDDKMKYIDPITSLKNRNYLNQNIEKWDENVIFPQAIVMLDVNKLKEINDKDGREVGDDILKQTASVLINSQKENTDILRSSGDEFMIYMVGYEENDVKEYINELSKKIRSIPHGYGCEFGYSMIYDEVKIIDDAINEAVIMLKQNKENNK